MSLAGRCAFVWALFALPAHAQFAATLPEQVTIRWRSSVCARPLGLEAEVARLLGPELNELAPIELRAEVEQRALDYELTLHVHDATRELERRVQLASCDEVRDAATLLIATAIDPDAVLRAAPSETPAAPSALPPVAPEPAPVAPVSSSRWSLLLGGVGDLQSLPGPSGGPSAGALVALRPLRLSALARYLLARTQAAPESELATELDLFLFGLGAQLAWKVGPFLLGPGVEAEFGVLRARTRGPNHAGTGTAPWGSALLGGAMAWGASARVGVELGVFAGLPLWYPRLAREERKSSPFYSTEPFTVRVALALRISLDSKDSPTSGHW